MSESPTTIRQSVARAYGDAISVRRGGCCQPSCCAEPSSSPATSIGYTEADLDAVPETAAGSSFGCGNPLAFAAVAPGETVLDLGSGAGLDLLLAARAVGPEGRVIGVDMTDEMIATARANVTRAGLANVEVRKGLIEDLPVEPASVDWVISNCVINLSPEKDRVFAEIFRVLRPGGTMQVSDLVVDDLPADLRRRRDLYSACVGGAVSEAEYLAGLAAAGLVDAEIIERVTYSAAAIRGLLDSDGVQAASGGRLCLDEGEAAALAVALDGKVHSLKMRARKPAGDG